MRRIERLHAITEELRRAAPGAVPARALAERLGVSRRTIERDLATLRMAGLPTYGQMGRTGGTAIVGTGNRSLVSLSTAEIVSLIVAGASFAIGGEKKPKATRAKKAKKEKGPKAKKEKKAKAPKPKKEKKARFGKKKK